MSAIVSRLSEICLSSAALRNTISVWFSVSPCMTCSCSMVRSSLRTFFRQPLEIGLVHGVRRKYGDDE